MVSNDVPGKLGPAEWVSSERDADAAGSLPHKELPEMPRYSNFGVAADRT